MKQTATEIEVKICQGHTYFCVSPIQNCRPLVFSVKGSSSICTKNDSFSSSSVLGLGDIISRNTSLNKTCFNRLHFIFVSVLTLRFDLLNLTEPLYYIVDVLEI